MYHMYFFRRLEPMNFFNSKTKRVITIVIVALVVLALVLGTIAAFV